MTISVATGRAEWSLRYHPRSERRVRSFIVVKCEIPLQPRRRVRTRCHPHPTGHCGPRSPSERQMAHVAHALVPGISGQSFPRNDGNEDAHVEAPKKDRCVIVGGQEIGRATIPHIAFWKFASWLHIDWLAQVSEGLEHLPLHRGAFIMTSNHQSHLDCSTLYVAAKLGGVKKTYALGARDYFFRNPFKRWFVTSFMSVIPIGRRGFTQQDVEVLYQLLDIGTPDNPVAVVMFPEGTRSMDGQLQPFKRGVGYLASRLGVPVVPSYIKGTRESLPKRRTVPIREKVRIRFGEPLEPPVSLNGDQRGLRQEDKRLLDEFCEELREATLSIREDMEEDLRAATPGAAAVDCGVQGVAAAPASGEEEGRASAGSRDATSMGGDTALAALQPAQEAALNRAEEGRVSSGATARGASVQRTAELGDSPAPDSGLRLDHGSTGPGRDDPAGFLDGEGHAIQQTTSSSQPAPDAVNPSSYDTDPAPSEDSTGPVNAEAGLRPAVGTAGRAGIRRRWRRRIRRGMRSRSSVRLRHHKTQLSLISQVFIALLSVLSYFLRFVGDFSRFIGSLVSRVHPIKL